MSLSHEYELSEVLCTAKLFYNLVIPILSPFCEFDSPASVHFTLWQIIHEICLVSEQGLPFKCRMLLKN